MGLLTSVESGLRRQADELAEGYLRSRGNVGLVIGLLVRDECLWLAYGTTGQGTSRPPDAGTVFEIGSITKVFTAALLAEMAGRDEVRLDQPVVELLLPRGPHTLLLRAGDHPCPPGRAYRGSAPIAA